MRERNLDGLCARGVPFFVGGSRREADPNLNRRVEEVGELVGGVDDGQAWKIHLRSAT